MSQLSLKDLSLFPATPEQVLESRKRTANEWRRALTKEQYVHRDVIMDKYEHAVDGKVTVWVLAPRNNPTKLEFMCSCETFRRISTVATPSEGSTAQEVTGYGIASVFTPTGNRRKGYAQHMMRLLHWVLAPRSALKAEFPPAWGAPPVVPAAFGNAKFSVLYSDIGNEFYRACGPTQETGGGWAERGCTQTVLDLTAARGPPRTSGGNSVSVWTDLSEQDARKVWEKDAEWMKADVAHAASTFGRTVCTFLPNHGVGAFTIRRTMTLTADMQPALPLETWGALLLPRENTTLDEALDVGTQERTTYATWMLDMLAPERTFVITRLRATKETFPLIFAKLIDQGRQQQIVRMEIWDLPDDLKRSAHKLGWVTEDRREHLSSLKWYGKEKGDDVEWMFNEKFCWC